MILNNYWKIRWAIETLITVSSSAPYGIDVGLKDLGGVSRAITLRPYPNNNVGYTYQAIVRMNSGYNIRLGSGDNELTADDYALTNDVTSSFTNLTYNYVSDANNHLRRVISISGQNNTNTDITITEIAYTKNLPYDDATQSCEVMYSIVKLDTPINVPANGTFSATFEWVEQ